MGQREVEILNMADLPIWAFGLGMIIGALLSRLPQSREMVE
jgi:hypothetical protein